MVIQRRTVWIGAGLLVGVVIVIAMWGSSESPAAVNGPARRPARDQSATKGTASDEGPVEVVNLAALKNERGEPIDAGRNPFLFQNRRAPEADPEAAPPPGKRPGQPAPGPVEAPKPFTPQGPPPPPPLPPIPLKLFGIAEQGGRKVAMLTDGRDPEAGKEGTIVYGQYLILKIGQESVEMAYADGRGRTTIRLTGQ